MKLGVLCATEREFQKIRKGLSELKEERVLGRTYLSGEYQGKQVVATQCGVGKVSSALSVAGFVEHFGCERILFVGTAGALAADLRVGDVVVSTGCI